MAYQTVTEPVTMAAAPPLDRRALPADLTVGRWTCPDGWALRRLDLGTGSRRLLFLSGRADFTEKYLEAIAHWAARGWAVTSFDWRGQGASRGGMAGEAALDALLDDLDGFVRGWAAERPGLQAVVAHSMGGHLALRLMLERGWRPAAGALVAPMLGINTGPLPRPLARLLADGAVRLGLSDRAIARDPGRLRERLLTGSAERLADAAWWRDANPGWVVGPPRWGWLAGAFRSIAAQDQALAAPPPDLPPLLLLSAGREHLVDNRAIGRVAGLLGAARRHWPAARHELLREADPVRLEALAAIDGFLDEAVPA